MNQFGLRIVYNGPEAVCRRRFLDCVTRVNLLKGVPMEYHTPDAVRMFNVAKKENRDAALVGEEPPFTVELIPGRRSGNFEDDVPDRSDEAPKAGAAAGKPEQAPSASPPPPVSDETSKAGGKRAGAAAGK